MPPQILRYRDNYFTHFTHEKIEAYRGKEFFPSLYNVQVNIESELEASPRLSARPLTTVHTHLTHFQIAFIKTSTNHQMNAKVYYS